jgi:nicotinamide-nucleotide amidase
MITAEILATGDEIRSGALVDSNSAYIARKLEAAGVAVVRHSCVGDDLKHLATVIQEIGARGDLAVVTGGLGPTGDDLSAAAAAAAAGRPLEKNEAAWASINAFFAARNREVSEANRKPAYLPAGSRCLPNPVGTAPGFSLDVGRCRFFFVPGVPFEMRRMVSDYVLPYLEQVQSGSRHYRRVETLSLFGLPESVVSERLAGMEDELTGIKLGLRAKFPEIQVKLYADGSDPERLNRLLARGRKWARDKLGDTVFSEDNRSLQQVVGGLLRADGATLALAESCTGGLIANWITDVPGSSDYFLFSGVTYANQAKSQFVGVDPAVIVACGAVDETVVRQMAAGVRDAAQATYALATSGIAGPGGGSPEKPVGTVCIGLATPQRVQSRTHHFSYGNRGMNKQIFAMKALDTLRRELLAD